MYELKFETIWFDQRKYEEAESRSVQQQSVTEGSSQRSSIVDQIAKARETIQQTLKGESGHASEPVDANVGKRLKSLEEENKQLKDAIKNIQLSLSKLEARVANIEISKEGQASTQPADKKETNTKQESDDDDDLDEDDLFGSDDDEEKEKQKQLRLAQYEAKKAKKPATVAKSNIILDVKPWDDETDMAVLEEKVRSVTCDGLLWGKSKLVPVGYGIKKLQINCVVEDDKVGTDFLEEEITKFEDTIQSVDIAAFNKV